METVTNQEQGEPVAWMGEMHGPRGGPWTAFIEHKPSLNVMDATTKWTPLYTTPQQRKPLTDDEIWKSDDIMAANSGYGANFETLREVVRAIEAAHGIA